MAGLRKPGSTEALIGILDRLERMVEYARDASDESVRVLDTVSNTLQKGVTAELVKQTRILDEIRSRLNRTGVSPTQVAMSRQTLLLEDIRSKLTSTGVTPEQAELVKQTRLLEDIRARLVRGRSTPEELELSKQTLLLEGISAKLTITGVTPEQLEMSKQTRLLEDIRTRLVNTNVGITPEQVEMSKQTRILDDIRSSLSRKGASEQGAAPNLDRDQLEELRTQSRALGAISSGARSLIDASTQQISLLRAISEQLAKAPPGQPKAGEAERFAAVFGGLSKSLTDLLQVAALVSDDKAESIKKFLLSVADSVGAFLDKVDAKKAQAAGDSLRAIAHAAGGFALVMALATPLLTVAVVGAGLLGLSLAIIGRGIQGVTKEEVDAMKAVLHLGGGALLFGVSMALYSMMAVDVIVGSVMFAGALRIVSYAVTGVKKDDVEATQGVLALGVGAVLFGGALALYSLYAVPALLGAIVFATTLKIVTTVIDEVGVDQKKVDSVASILSLAKGVALFSLVMFGISFAMPRVLAGSVIFALSIGAILLAMRLAPEKDVSEGVKSIFKISLGLVTLAAGMLIFSALVTPEIAIETILTVGAVGISWWLLGKMADGIEGGAEAMFFVSLSLVFLAVGVFAFRATGVGPGDGLAIALTVGLLALPFALAGIGPIPEAIGMGAVALGIAAISLGLISLGLYIYKQVGFTSDDGIGLAAVLTGLGVVFGLAGIPPVALSIALGSIALGIAGLSLMLIAGGLAAFRAVDFDEDDGDRMKYALGSLVTAFLGGENPGGLLGSIKYAAGIAARTALLVVSIPPLIMAAGALALISVGLAAFKAVQFDESDADRLSYTIASFVKAFSIITDKDRQRELGIDISPASLFASTLSLVALGGVVASLAYGISAMANLEIVEHEVKGGKLVVKSSRKMSDADFQAASDNVARIISTLTEPLAIVGMIEKEGSSGNALYDAIFSNGYISTGIDAIKDLGTTISTLGQGVQDFANLAITEYVVKDGKLVPKSTRKMTQGDFTAASANIGLVIGFLAVEFAKIGKMENDSSGWFSDGIVTNGIEAINGLGGNLVELAKGIVSMANLEYVENEIQIIKGRPTLVPKKVHKIGPGEMAAASANIGAILGFLAMEFAKVGKMEDDSSGWFSDGYVSKGRDAILGMGKDISSIVDAIIKVANSEFTTYEVRDGQLVPVSTRKMAPADIAKAAGTIRAVVGAFAVQMADAGRMLAGREDDLKVAGKYLPKFSEFVGSSADGLAKWAQIPDPQKAMNGLHSFVESVKAHFDSKRDAGLPLKLAFFQVFSANVGKLADAGDGLEKAAAASERIEKSFKGIQGSVNAMDLKKLTLTDSMMRSMAELSKSPEKTGKVIEGALNKAFEKLIEALQEMSGKSPTQALPQAYLPAQPAAKPQPALQPAFTAPAAQAAANMAQQLQALFSTLPADIAEALQTVVLRTQEVNKAGVG